MKKNKLSLDFIENGRISEIEMQNVIGGGHNCPGRSGCPTYDPPCKFIGCTAYSNQ